MLANGDPAKEQAIAEVLCTLQRCNINGTSGTNGGDSIALLNAGNDMNRDNPAEYAAIKQEILKDSVLLTGNNSYGSYGSSWWGAGTYYATTDEAGLRWQNIRAGFGMAAKVDDSATKNLAIGVGKGVGQVVLGALNTGPQVVNGYAYMYQAATGQPISNLIDPLPTLGAWLPQGGAQQAGSIAAQIAAGAIIGYFGSGGTPAAQALGDSALVRAGSVDADSAAMGDVPVAGSIGNVNPTVGNISGSGGTPAAQALGDLTSGGTGSLDGAGGTINVPKTIPYQPSGTVVLQGNAPVCGPACAAMVVSDGTGNSVSLADMIGSFTNGIRPTGVSTTELSNVISGTGVQNTVETTMLPGQLNQALQDGQTVIVQVPVGIDNQHFIIVDGVQSVNGVNYYMTRDPLVGPRGVLSSTLNNAISTGVNAIVIGK